MRPAAFLTAFGAAIWGISAGWAALRAAWAAPSWPALAAVGGYLALFLVAFGTLGFGLYAAERAAGRVKRTIRVYERLLGLRDRGTGNGERTATIHGR